MRFCHQCGTELANADFKFCPSCGAQLQPPAAKSEAANTLHNSKANQVALIVLCVLTIIGSAIGLMKSIGYLVMVAGYQSSQYYYSSESNNNNFLYSSAFLIISNVGTLGGAILMIKRRILGYYIYLICQLMGILVHITQAFSGVSDAGGWPFNLFGLGFNLVSAVPPLVFLMLFTIFVKKQLQ